MNIIYIYYISSERERETAAMPPPCVCPIDGPNILHCYAYPPTYARTHIYNQHIRAGQKLLSKIGDIFTAQKLTWPLLIQDMLTKI